MRVTTFLSGLFLTTVVFAAPLARPQDDITDANPFDISKRVDLPVKLPVKVPSTDAVEGELTAVTNKVTIDGPKIPVRRDLDGLADSLAPVLELVSGLLNSVLSNLSSADSKVQTLISNLKVNVSDIVDTIKKDLDSAVDEVAELVKTLENDTNSAVDEVKTLVAEVEIAAGQLLADLEKIEDSVPSVASLISEVKSLIQTVQGLGL